uniref:ADH_N domain-containing protein n=2 Tax=Ascaris lumbricoides TaxID=6252 RepID=A0A0M3HG75_ASCLU
MNYRSDIRISAPHRRHTIHKYEHMKLEKSCEIVLSHLCYEAFCGDALNFRMPHAEIQSIIIEHPQRHVRDSPIAFPDDKPIQGIFIQIGAGVKSMTVGDRVIPFTIRNPTWTNYAIVKADDLRTVDKHLKIVRLFLY